MADATCLRPSVVREVLILSRFCNSGLWYWEYGLLIGYGFALIYAVAPSGAKPNRSIDKARDVAFVPDRTFPWGHYSYYTYEAGAIPAGYFCAELSAEWGRVCHALSKLLWSQFLHCKDRYRRTSIITLSTFVWSLSTTMQAVVTWMVYRKFAIRRLSFLGWWSFVVLIRVVRQLHEIHPCLCGRSGSLLHTFLRGASHWIHTAPLLSHHDWPGTVPWDTSLLVVTWPTSFGSKKSEAVWGLSVCLLVYFWPPPMAKMLVTVANHETWRACWDDMLRLLVDYFASSGLGTSTYTIQAWG